MSNPDALGWVHDHEIASEKIVRYEDQLQGQIENHLRDGRLFEAGLIAFEHSELLALLRESPSARHVAEFAILATQKDMDLAVIALDMINEEAPLDNNIHIMEAKFVLRNAIEERGYAPRDLVRQLGIAYLGDAPEASKRTDKQWSHWTDGSEAYRFLRRHVIRGVILEVDDKEIGLDFITVTAHRRRNFMPGFQQTSQHSAHEWLQYYDGMNSFRLEVDPSSEMDSDKMAEALLSLPDEPSYLIGAYPVNAELPTIEQRLSKLDNEEERWMTLLESRPHAYEIVENELIAIRSERANLIQNKL